MFICVLCSQKLVLKDAPNSLFTLLKEQVRSDLKVLTLSAYSYKMFTATPNSFFK